MQAIILALLEKFEFSLPPQSEKTKVYRKPGYVMLPMAEGEKGIWMGLLIKPVKCSEVVIADLCVFELSES